MSRLSRANLKARESVFNTGPEMYWGDIQAICPPNLIDCVAALESCCEEAQAAQVLLRSGTDDYPRMTKVLSNERVFLIVNEGLVKTYKADLIDEVEPAVNALLAKAEHGLKLLQRREAQLRTKQEALKSLPAKPASGTMAQHKLDQRKMHSLTKRKERLRDELAALESELKGLDARR